MIFNFKKIIESLFKSFDVSGDTKALEKLEKDWVRFLVFLKRHWIYWLYHSRRVLAVIIISIINIILLFFHNEAFISWIIWIILIVSIVYWLFIIIVYFANFHKIQWSRPHIEDINSAIKKSDKSDEVFTTFFNHTLLLFIILIILSIFMISMWIKKIFDWWEWSQTYIIEILNGFLFLPQLWLYYWYLKKMMNQEMDYRIIIPWKIMYCNQNWIIKSDTRSINYDKVKSITTQYKWIVNSFFNFWDIIILTEWDPSSDNKWEIHLNYTWHPNSTLKEMEKVLNNNLKAIEDEVNVLLSKINLENGIDDVSDQKQLEKLKDYVLKNENYFKELYDKWNEDIKKEVKQLYVLINR